MSEQFTPPTFETKDYLGPIRDIEPLVDAYALGSQPLSPEQQTEALKIARRESGLDSVQNSVIVQSGGEHYWASEYPNVFTFDDAIRGSIENFSSDGEPTSVEAINGTGGESTHAMIETDDGHVFVFRRTNNEQEAAKQTFKVTSTTLHMGQGDETTLLGREIDTEQLKGVVVRPGQPLVLGNDPSSGKAMRTRGNVVRVTSIQCTEEGKVAQNHPHLNREEKNRDAPSRFLEAIKFARTMDAASKIGPLLVRAS